MSVRVWVKVLSPTGWACPKVKLRVFSRSEALKKIYFKNTCVFKCYLFKRRREEPLVKMGNQLYNGGKRVGLCVVSPKWAS